MECKMNVLVGIQKVEVGSEVNSVNARELHKTLEVGRDYSNWIKARIKKYVFIENEDYILVESKKEGNNATIKEYYITLDMAKELSMVENNAKGREARKYFIEVEKEHREAQSPLLSVQSKELNQRIGALEVELYNSKRELTEARRLIGRHDYNSKASTVLDERRYGKNAFLDLMGQVKRDRISKDLMLRELLEEKNSMNAILGKFLSVYPEFNEAYGLD